MNPPETLVSTPESLMSTPDPRHPLPYHRRKEHKP